MPRWRRDDLRSRHCGFDVAACGRSRPRRSPTNPVYGCAARRRLDTRRSEHQSEHERCSTADTDRHAAKIRVAEVRTSDVVTVAAGTTCMSISTQPRLSRHASRVVEAPDVERRVVAVGIRGCARREYRSGRESDDEDAAEPSRPIPSGGFHPLLPARAAGHRDRVAVALRRSVRAAKEALKHTVASQLRPTHGDALGCCGGRSRRAPAHCTRGSSRRRFCRCPGPAHGPEYPVPAGSHPHDVAPAPTGGSGTRARPGRARPARPADGPIRRSRSGGLGAARRDRRAGRRGLGHRRRAERDRARRPGDAARCGASRCRPTRLREPEHGHVRPARHPLVHRAERRLRPRSTRARRECGCSGAARRRSVRHRDHAGRRGLLRLARGQPHRPDRHANGRGDRDRAADARPGRAAGVVGLEGPALGERVERGQGRRATTRHAPLARVAAARARIRSRTRSTWTSATWCG